MNDMNYSEKLKTGTAVGYGIGAIGEGIGYNVFFSFFSFFLTTIAGIQPAVAGVISMAAVLWDAVTDPIIGLWSDRTKNPRGRRRPFIMTGSVLLCASVTLLFTNIEMSQNMKVVYFIVMNIFYWVTLTSCVIPHRVRRKWISHPCRQCSCKYIKRRTPHFSTTDLRESRHCFNDLCPIDRLVSKKAFLGRSLAGVEALLRVSSQCYLPK